jgi:hypothetical protein
MKALLLITLFILAADFSDAKINSAISTGLETANEDFPADVTRQRHFDTLNSFVDSINAFLFNINGNMQSRFDNNVATILAYWRSAQIFANTVSTRRVMHQCHVL